LRTKAGRFIASRDLKAQSAHDQKILVWPIAPGLLSTGDYELTLSGLTQQQKIEVIGYYYFKVLKK
jgi:hypothetical protein